MKYIYIYTYYSGLALQDVVKGQHNRERWPAVQITFGLFNIVLIYTFLSIQKIRSSMARSLPVENLLPQNVGPIINHLQ